MDANTTGRFIARLRKQKGYTQKELAEKLMVTDKAISRWETGKGLPDTSLLKPLGDILGVSVGELLSGERIEAAEMKDQADKIILESLEYSKRMAAGIIRAILFMTGIALALSPLFLASQSRIWILGLVMAAVGALGARMGTMRRRMAAGSSACYTAAIGMLCAALILEVLPLGAVMVFAAGPGEYSTEVFSYFSLLPLGYANFAPMLTGILTIAAVLPGAAAIAGFDQSSKLKKAAFLCGALAFLFSITPLFLFGAAGMAATSYGVSGALFLSVCLQAVANRKERT